MTGLTDEMKEQLNEAATQTNKAYLAVRRGRDVDGSERRNAYGEAASKGAPTGRLLNPEVSCMQPILRFLQLLCENHNADLQVISVALLRPSYLSNSINLSLFLK